MHTTMFSHLQAGCQLIQAAIYTLRVYAVHTQEEGVLDICLYKQVLQGTDMEHDCLPVNTTSLLEVHGRSHLTPSMPLTAKQLDVARCVTGQES